MRISKRERALKTHTEDRQRLVGDAGKLRCSSWWQWSGSRRADERACQNGSSQLRLGTVRYATGRAQTNTIGMTNRSESLPIPRKAVRHGCQSCGWPSRFSVLTGHTGCHIVRVYSPRWDGGRWSMIVRTRSGVKIPITWLPKQTPLRSTLATSSSCFWRGQRTTRERQARTPADPRSASRGHTRSTGPR